ncbi:MAG: hypothetical protein QG621_542 [Patescibacteria group bacterium]|nr:hypothetical protein [Patescibacteria group bacterium]
MRLLLCTQVVDKGDSNLGFFHRWIEEFAKHCEEVVVICLREGVHELPHNVRVLSLGKEYDTWRLTRVYRFLRYIWEYREHYDAVLVHMNPEYVVLGGRLWKRWHKPIGLWYAHKSVTRKLRYAMRFLNRVFTVSQDSFRIATPKVCVLGHGIDTALFKPDIHTESTELRIVTAGRIAASKHLLEMLQTLDVLHERNEQFVFTVVGEATTAQERTYKEEFEKAIQERPYRDKVHLVGAVKYHKLPALLRTQDVALNFGATGNMDKAGLEALAAGVPLLATNPQFATLLEPHGLYVLGDATRAADMLQKFLSRPDRPAIVATLRNKVVEEHSLEKLIPKILMNLAE